MALLATASGGDVALASVTMLTAFLTVGLPAIVKARKADRDARKAAVAAADGAARAAAEAKQAAAEATKTVEAMKSTLGEKNGNGDAMTMLAKTLGNQYEMLQNQQHVKELVETSAARQIEDAETMRKHIVSDEAFQARVEPFLRVAEGSGEPGSTQSQ